MAPDLLDQDVTAAGPDEKWGADISYIWTKEGWLYLAVVIDLFARRVVGWPTGDRLHRDLTLAALRKAVLLRCPAAGLIHHSDRGSQYCSVDYQTELKAKGILMSMFGRGHRFGNAMVETFVKTLKSELVWRTAFETRADAASGIGRAIDGFYNPIRRHSSRDFTSPAQFERMAVARPNAAPLKRGKSNRSTTALQHAFEVTVAACGRRAPADDVEDDGGSELPAFDGSICPEMRHPPLSQVRTRPRQAANDTTAPNIEHTRLSGEAARTILAGRATAAGITAHSTERLSPHGLRAGFVTKADIAGARDEQLMDHTCDRDSKTICGDVRRAKLVTESVSKLLDL